MKKTRKDKGITLIALIITIIVLLILALVTINSITGDGDLIAHAQNAGTKYTTEGKNENSMVQNYLEKIKEISNNTGNNKSDLSGTITYYSYSAEKFGTIEDLRNTIKEDYITINYDNNTITCVGNKTYCELNWHYDNENNMFIAQEENEDKGEYYYCKLIFSETKVEIYESEKEENIGIENVTDWEENSSCGCYRKENSGISLAGKTFKSGEDKWINFINDYACQTYRCDDDEYFAYYTDGNDLQIYDATYTLSSDGNTITYIYDEETTTYTLTNS